MKLIDLSATTDRALELLAASGISAKNLKGYTHTGFGGITRYFHRKGVLCVSEEMLDVFVSEQRVMFEQKKISAWTWRLIRRSSELLKLCAATDSVYLPNLQPWEPVLRRPRQSIRNSIPSEEQLSDKNNIFALVWKANKIMLDLGLSEATVAHYRNDGLSIILKRHYEAGTEQYSAEIVSQIVMDKRKKYEQGLTSRVSYQNLRKAAYMLQELYQTGNAVLKKVPNWGQRELNRELEAVLNEMCTRITRERDFTDSTVKAIRSPARRFLLELEDCGITSLKSVTAADINTCVVKMLGRYAGGMGTALWGIRIFLHFLYEEGITYADLSMSLPEFVAPRKNFHEGFTAEELEQLLVQPDINTAIGKRNYAMMVLAVQSGLRACDIVRLELRDIDWRLREVRIVQHKTGQPLTVPLLAESGNAIADYILNGRPKSGLPYLFLCHSGEARSLGAGSVSYIMSNYMKRAEVPAARRGFHSFRRTFATNLLQDEVSFELIQQLLGHRDMDSMKPYLSIDEQGLKMCALPLQFPGEDGDGR